jgi:hypothetical protein
MQDRAYVRAIFSRFSTTAVLALLEDMVRSGERSEVHLALLFTGTQFSTA